MSGRRRKDHVRLPRQRRLPPDAASGLCSSGKVGYRTRNLARSEGARTSAARGVPIGVYPCDECKRWHKTKNTWGTTQPTGKLGRSNGQHQKT